MPRLRQWVPLGGGGVNRWTAEGGRSMTVYAGAYAEAFWLGLAMLVLGWVWLREWATRPGMAPAEQFGVLAMVGWCAILVSVVLLH